MRVSMLLSLITLLFLHQKIQGSQSVRQLLDVGSTVIEEQPTEKQLLQQSIVDLLREKDQEGAAEVITNTVQDDKTSLMIDVIVQIVNSNERPVVNRLSGTLVVIQKENPGAYREILSTGLSDRQAVERINAFDKLLCLQTSANDDVCYGFDTLPETFQEMKSAEIQEEEYIEEIDISEDFGEVPTDPTSSIGQKMLSQLLNGDYNSAAWTVVGSADTFDKLDYARAINSAMLEGAGGAAGESMLQALRLAARQGESEKVSILMSQLLLQNYRKDVIPLLAKASAFASLDGLDDGVQRMVRAAIEAGGNVRSILEVMNQIAAQGGNTGVKDMAIVVIGAESSGAQIATLVKVLAYSLCRGGVFWDSFGRIYDYAVELNGCGSIQNSFLRGVSTANTQCPEDVPQDLYESSPSLELCNFTDTSSSMMTLEIDEVTITSSEIDNSNIDFIKETTTSSAQEPAVSLTPMVELSTPTKQQEEVSVSEAFDENVENTQDATSSSTQSVLQSLMASLTRKDSDDDSNNSDEEYQQVQIIIPEESDEAEVVATVQSNPPVVALTKADNVVVGDDDAQQENDAQCMDIVPEDNITATCEERKGWGGCEKEWMIEENFCAKTCGFCGQDITVSIEIEELAPMTTIQKETVDETTITNDDDAAVDTPTPKPPAKQKSNKCKDITPADNSTATCAERKEWGGCEKDWMIEENYCAKTCGFCSNDQKAPETKITTTTTTQESTVSSKSEKDTQNTTPDAPNNVEDVQNVPKNAEDVQNVPDAIPAPTTTATPPTKIDTQKDDAVKSSAPVPALGWLLAQMSNNIQSVEKEDENESVQLEQKSNIVQNQEQLVKVDAQSEDDCVDIVPEDDLEVVTCAERLERGACEKDWMIDGNYCAKTCGFCTSITV